MKYIRKFITLCLLMIAIQSYAESDRSVRILLIGDSATAGETPRIVHPKGPHLEQIIEQQLALEPDLPPVEVINSAQHGETARRLVKGNYDKSIAEVGDIDFVFIRLGANDLKRSEDFAAEFPLHLKSLIARVKKDHSNAEIVLMTNIPFFKEGESEEVNKLIRRVAEQDELKLLDIYPVFAKTLEKYGAHSLYCRNIPLKEVPEEHREQVSSHVYLDPRSNQKHVMMIDPRLDSILGDIRKWYWDRNPNLVGYRLIGTEIANFISPLLPAWQPPAITGLSSIDTGEYTITKVRTAVKNKKSYIVASSYEGTVLGIGHQGKIMWKNRLSGFMNHDVWCEDITGDDNDEILAANADGSVYCLDDEGKLMWSFAPNSAPMNAVCTIESEGERYVVCGGYDKSFYYLTNSGDLAKEVKSSTYSIERSWGKGHQRIPPKRVHTVNFLRRIRIAGDKELLAVNGVNNTLAGSGTIYLFEPLSDKPVRSVKLPGGMPVGEMRVRDTNGDGNEEILLGTSAMITESGIFTVAPLTGELRMLNVSEHRVIRRNLDNFGYRVLQPELVEVDGVKQMMLLFGSKMILLKADTQLPLEDARPNGSFSLDRADVLTCRYSFNDMWKDTENKKLILASSQSGGSCIHILDLQSPGWTIAYEKLAPPGKISRIIELADSTREQMSAFKKPEKERQPLPVYFMTELIPETLTDLVKSIQEDGVGPVFLKGDRLPKVEKWDRSGMPNKRYREKRDSRAKYTLSSDEIVAKLSAHFKDSPGISYWGGHGNDPYMLSLATQKKVIDAANGKKVVTIYPELEDPSEDFKFVLDDLIYPLASHCQGKNANMFIRTKHLFWQSSVYKPMWSRLISGEFSDVFVPAMEETTDKSMELSLAARMGIWASGSVDDWGTRCARDNPSFDRLRQHSHQMLPNHFLRTMIYNLASGARYANNFRVDQEYMSILWELLDKGVLYVPQRNEIVSFSPVHLSIENPDEHYEDDGGNVKWTTFYDEKLEANNPFVFSRLNGTWPGAPVTEWDFSRYAAGVKERRLGFIPPYPNGMVLITPARRNIEDQLHPLYQGILKEYHTDGRHYYSADGKQQSADEYYKVIKSEIQEGAKKLPLTVSGDVGWVAVQTSPKRLRITLVDSGYINPKNRTAKVTFHSVKPKKAVDLLSNESFEIPDDLTISIDIPGGHFRFIDIELAEDI